jgi:hypothetical protein
MTKKHNWYKSKLNLHWIRIVPYSSFAQYIDNVNQSRRKYQKKFENKMTPLGGNCVTMQSIRIEAGGVGWCPPPLSHSLLLSEQLRATMID